MKRSTKNFLAFFSLASLLCTADGGSETFYRFPNETDTFSCLGVEAAGYLARGIPRVRLTDEQKFQLLHSLRGDFVSSIMSFPGQSPRAADTRNVLAQGARCSEEEHSEHKCFTRSEIIALLKAEAATGKRDHNLPFEYVLPPASMNDPANGIVADFCIERSKPYFSSDSSDSTIKYLRMCKVCSITRYRPPNEWPPVVFESVCDPNELGCLYEGTTSNGKCQQAELTFDLLRADPNLCEIMIIDGQTVVTEKWSLKQEELGSGCECGIVSKSGEIPRFT